jgi:hypothetical protein
MSIVHKSTVLGIIRRGDMPLSEISARLGLDVTTIWRWSKEAGIDAQSQLARAYDKRWGKAMNGKAHGRTRWGQLSQEKLKRVDPNERIGLALRCKNCGHATSIKVKAKDYFKLGFHARLKCSKCGVSYDEPHKASDAMRDRNDRGEA